MLTFFDNIREICKKSNVPFAQLERELGFGNGTIQKWDKSNPGIDKVLAVAKHFGVSVDVLLGRSEYQLSDETRKIAAQFESLPQEKKNLVKCYMGVIGVN